jgi:hypothetical protein
MFKLSRPNSQPNTADRLSASSPENRMMFYQNQPPIQQIPEVLLFPYLSEKVLFFAYLAL